MSDVPLVTHGWRTATVREAIRETPTATTLVLDIPGWPGHRAGQHVDVRLTAEDGYQASRSYSVSSAPGDTPSVTVEKLDDGEVSPYLVDDAQPGDELEVRGPVGGWFVWDTDKGGPLQLIGGGSGLAPLMSILRHHRRTGSDVEARLLLSARGPRDVLFAGELVDPVITYTREPPPDWSGYARRIDRAMLEDAVLPPDRDPRIYVCGPTGLVEGVAADLVALGHDPARIRTERFGATGG
jgi:ferredoxin-NADP reductase